MGDGAPGASVFDEVRGGVFGAGFVKFVDTALRGGSRSRVSIRPVAIAGKRLFQVSNTEVLR